MHNLTGDGQAILASTPSAGKGNVVEALIDLTAGSLGGCANVFVGQPLDTVKVKMQTFPDLYKNGLSCFAKTLKQDGIRGLYAGTIPSLAANVGENSVLFAAYGFCQKGVQISVNKSTIDDLNPLENASAGFLAAFFSSFTLCPTELVKCRLQALRETSAACEGLSKPSIGPWGMTRQILITEGIPGMFRGLTPTFAREMPGYFFFFGGYELSRTLLTPSGTSKDDIGLLGTVVSGGIGGMCLWGSIFPFDVVKSRMQIGNYGSETMVSVFMNIARKEGVRALYNGLGPTLLRTFPSSGALFVAYEWTKKGLNYLRN